VIYGGRVSLTIGFFVVIVTGIAGTTIGALAGYFRRLDNPLMRLMDALMAFPAILLAIVISAVLGASVTNVVIALSIADLPAHRAHRARLGAGGGARWNMSRPAARSAPAIFDCCSATC